VLSSCCTWLPPEHCNTCCCCCCCWLLDWRMALEEKSMAVCGPHGQLFGKKAEPGSALLKLPCLERLASGCKAAMCRLKGLAHAGAVCPVLSPVVKLLA